MPDGAPTEMFKSWRDYWTFAQSVRREFRYVRTSETEEFLRAVLATSIDRRVVIPAESLFWRAQSGHDRRPMNSDSDEEIPCAHPRSRMKPIPGKAWDGRANPKGIPCLYLATTKETAMSEVRPWIGSYISAGQFRTRRDLTIINCTMGEKAPLFFFGEPDAETQKNAVWAHINSAFAEPMTRSDDLADYAPTQVLAEFFKHEGLDGIVYRSNFGERGFNIALFDPDVADLINCGLFKVKKMELAFEEADQFYFASELASPPAAVADNN